MGRRRREEKAHAVAIIGRGAIDWIFCFRIVIYAVLGVQHADERPVRRLEHTPMRKIHALPIAGCYAASALLRDAHVSIRPLKKITEYHGKQQELCALTHESPPV
ncbi:MAG: hypothetical protein ACJ8G2_15070 [Burkholderiales bacterium]